MLSKLLHPGSRVVVMAKPQHLDVMFKGYLPAPWDCPHVERQICACHLRTFEPAAHQLDEARATLAKLEAGIAAAEEKATAPAPAPVADEPPAEPAPEAEEPPAEPRKKKGRG